MDNNNPSVVASRNLSLAVAKIDATPDENGWWSYYADEISSTCYVSSKELEKLGELLSDLETRRDAYSMWCTTVPTRLRLPAG